MMNRNGFRRLTVAGTLEVIRPTLQSASEESQPRAGDSAA